MTVSKDVEPGLRSVIDAELEMQKLKSGMGITKRKTKEELLREYRRTP
jgi:hypothetical protein